MDEVVYRLSFQEVHPAIQKGALGKLSSFRGLEIHLIKLIEESRNN